MSRNMVHDIEFSKVISTWDEGIPLGNGLTGSLIWGDGSPLRISLDRGDLWDTRIAPEWNEEDCTYAELIRLAQVGDRDSITRRFENAYTNHAFPTKIPAGRIELDFGAVCRDFSGRLSLSDATAHVKMHFEDGDCELTGFLHATKRYGRISIVGVLPRVDLESHIFSGGDVKAEEGCFDMSCSRLDYPPTETGEEGRITWYRQKTREELEFAVIVGIAVEDDTMSVVYMVACSTDGECWFEQAKTTVAAALEKPFDADHREHSKWWSDYWSKSSIALPDQQIEKLWYVANYLFGACSRKGAPPMPLQGVWTADEDKLPPWKGDYHNDLNTQMSYWHYVKANHMEEGESFVDFLWNLRDAGREFARKFYGAPGLCLPAVMSIDGKPLGGWSMYTLSIPNHLWLCQVFEKHWRYTADRDFLENRAYPYLKESAECVMHWLKPGEDGKLKLPVSSSPEIHCNELDAWLIPNSNHDLSILRYFFATLVDMANELGGADRELWQQTLDLLPELSVNKDNVLMLSPDESPFETHRHHAHAMAIYPLELLDYHGFERDREIIDATILNLEILGSGGWVGFSFPWMAEFYAYQGNGEGAAYQLKLFLECFCSRNGFHLNGDYKNRGLSCYHYRPFTLEANMAAADAVQEMLMQTRGGVIRLFPAVPEDWLENGISFKHLRAPGAILVSAEARGTGLKQVVLEPERDCTVKLFNSFGSDRIRVAGNDVASNVECAPGAIFKVKMAAGNTYTLTGPTGLR